MWLRISHNLCVVSLVYVFAPAGKSEFSVKESFYAQLQMVMDSYPKGDGLMILDDSNANTDTGRMDLRVVLVLTDLD